MPDPRNPFTPADFVTGVTDDLPYAVRADATTKPGGLTDDDLAGTPQAYFADVPSRPSARPDPSEDGFVAAGAKEGHGIGRRGVVLARLDPPPRPAVGPGARRPVVALLDSQVRTHEWLGSGEGTDPFWRDAREEPEGWGPMVGDPPVPVELPMEVADASATHSGHGTFIAGLVRQLAPGARVISMPLMDEKGIVDDRLVVPALAWVLDRCRRAEAEGRPQLFVDVVNLSFGHYLRGGRVVPDVDDVLTVLRALGDIGVRVVASAGNRATDHVVLPAAWSPDGWSPESPDGPHTGLVGVAALDPDGSPAVYTNHGEGVRLAAPGTDLVSALPTFTAVEPPPPVDRVAPVLGEDPNLRTSAFGRWSGTSFASGWVSASLAGHLLDADLGDLDDVSPKAARARAARSLAAALAEGDVRLWTAARDTA